LYVYNGKLFADDPSKNRHENLKPEFRAAIDSKYKQHFSPEMILGYVYAILYSSVYRKKYQTFLKGDFPRVPFVEDVATFQRLSAVGIALVQAHLLNPVPIGSEIEITKGSDLLKKAFHVKQDRRLYINESQYFWPVADNIWNFQIGAYQVLDSYLKIREGRKLTLDEIENIMDTIKVLEFTEARVSEIDSLWQP